MGTTLTYRHEDGINYNYIMPDLIVGSCLQGPEDADKLAAAGVTTVYSLQVSQAGRGVGCCYLTPLPAVLKREPRLAGSWNA